MRSPTHTHIQKRGQTQGAGYEIIIHTDFQNIIRGGAGGCGGLFRRAGLPVFLRSHQYHAGLRLCRGTDYRDQRLSGAGGGDVPLRRRHAGPQPVRRRAGRQEPDHGHRLSRQRRADPCGTAGGATAAAGAAVLFPDLLSGPGRGAEAGFHHQQRHPDPAAVHRRRGVQRRGRGGLRPEKRCAETGLYLILSGGDRGGDQGHGAVHQRLGELSERHGYHRAGGGYLLRRLRRL